MRTSLLVGSLIVFSALAGCATIDGIGRDISGGANRVSNWVN